MSHTRIPALRHHGFTLIELMIVVAVITILAAIALPSYRSYVMKSRRTDAKNGLLDLASREERYFSVNNTYTNDPTQLGYGAGSSFPLAINASGQSYYNLTAPTVTAASGSGATAVPPGFTAQAVPTGDQTADTTCATYQIDQLGTQTNSSGATTGCW
ncbi:MAG: type IV pilin protein [Proteobacteria bacterium]|nr:type IV pilin protein [Pseudomonadota bacterium]